MRKDDQIASYICISSVQLSSYTRVIGLRPWCAKNFCTGCNLKKQRIPTPCYRQINANVRPWTTAGTAKLASLRHYHTGHFIDGSGENDVRNRTRFSRADSIDIVMSTSGWTWTLYVYSSIYFHARFHFSVRVHINKVRGRLAFIIPQTRPAIRSRSISSIVAKNAPLVKYLLASTVSRRCCRRDHLLERATTIDP